MGYSKVKKELNKLTKEQIINVVGELYQKQSSVREYFEFFLNFDQGKLLEKYKKNIDNAFYTRMGNPKLDLKAAKTAVSDFSKLGVPAEYLAELYFYFVEIGTKFTHTFGDIDDKFYRTLENAFYEGLQILENEGLLNKFKERIETLEINAQGLGWWFSDTMTSIFMEFYGEMEEEDSENE